ncbi:nSTAND1 domain-containing NTPase, partial [Streptomyces winkii]|uniref:nSTAND1 domain-containing NTPase n=1 Tax=Streptomyces winkii TaxID=3051178 RepID=UPI0037D99A34
MGPERLDTGSVTADRRPSLAASVFQVLSEDGDVAGAGFLARDCIAFSCAHVVRAAGQAPGGRIEVIFPNLPDEPRTWGRVSTGEWRDPESEDVAILDLESVPAGARSMALGVCAGSRGHAVASFGFPTQAPPGGHFGYGKAGDLIPKGNGNSRLLQLSQANDLTTGFSGAPVLDEVTGLVIGMVTSITSPDTHLKGLGIAYATPSEELRNVQPGLAVSHVCPYLGLEPFTAEQATWFHGRETVVESVLAALERHGQMAMLLGPSGAGKSSVVKAGVLPALAEGAVPGSDRWLPVVTRPGQDLLAELEEAGLPGAASDGLTAAVEARMDAEPEHDRLLLVIDQFEELLTQPAPSGSGEPTHEGLTPAGQLVELMNSNVAVTVILIMRNDFYAALGAQASDLMDTALPGLVNVPATLSVEELSAIISRPADMVGLTLEAGLPERIINDLQNAEPAARKVPVTQLPLLELALRQLWSRRREDGCLTHSAYDKIGTITGSLTAWCNTVLRQLSPRQRPTARLILTALVRPADEANGLPATRRPLPVTRLRTLATDPELASSAAETTFNAVLADLTRYRIITTGTTTQPGTAPDESTAELIHDALIRNWSDLRDWVARDQQYQSWLNRAAGLQPRRHTSGRLPENELLGGTLLAEGRKWAEERPVAAEVTALLSANWQRRLTSVRRGRLLNGLLATVLALALVSQCDAFYEKRVVDVKVERARHLLDQSRSISDSDPDFASLIAVKAWKAIEDDETRAALYAAPAFPLRSRLAGHRWPVGSVAFSPDGDSLATGSDDGTARLWGVESGKVRATFKSHDESANVSSVAFSPDGDSLATGSDDGTARLWGVESGKVRATFKSHDESANVSSVAFSPDGDSLATGSDDGTARLWGVESGKVRATFKGHKDG